jgi:hypothetical protein
LGLRDDAYGSVHHERSKKDEAGPDDDRERRHSIPKQPDNRPPETARPGLVDAPNEDERGLELGEHPARAGDEREHADSCTDAARRVMRLQAFKGLFDEPLRLRRVRTDKARHQSVPRLVAVAEHEPDGGEREQDQRKEREEGRVRERRASPRTAVLRPPDGRVPQEHDRGFRRTHEGAPATSHRCYEYIGCRTTV